MRLHNTLTGKLDEFKPLSGDRVTLYTCGPTVYDFLHVGNWTAYIYWDILVRVLQANNFAVERVMNITDVGHLVSDGDEGEDKLEKGARREGKTAWDVAKFYTDDFVKGLALLNLVAPTHITKATDYIDQQLELVRTLKQKGHTYQIKDGIYFDTSTFPAYADFARLNLDALKAGARVSLSDEKRSPSDFALWKFSSADQQRDMEWETPPDLTDSGASQKGFPGWHLECSAMAMDLLGETIDIHTGGIDHIPVHHTNEIAQSESASGQRFANYWLHSNHLKADGTKISKSLGNGYTLEDLGERGYSALDLRLFVLQSHYRSEGNFTFENLEAAKNHLSNWRRVAVLRHQTHDTLSAHDSPASDRYVTLGPQVLTALDDDLATSKAVTLIDEAFSELETKTLTDISSRFLTDNIEDIDRLLGLDLLGSTPDITDDAKQLILERNHARESKDWQTSDKLRDQLSAQGIGLNDRTSSAIWYYL